jgi:hypothetical protein
MLRSRAILPPTEVGGIGVGGIGVLTTEEAGVICGVEGGGGAFSSCLGLAIWDAPNARVCDDSRRRLGASFIFGCV